MGCISNFSWFFFYIDWEQRKLGDVAVKVTEKNTQNRIKETFTNSAEMGVISQRDFFDHDIAKADKIDGYYIVQENDFIYNPRISVTAPCGPINRNKLGRNGVMSPLYTVFRTNNINPLFLEWYFKSSCWYAYMYFNGDSGARSDRFSIKSELFFDMPIPSPKKDEQGRVGLLLEKVNKLITLHQRKDIMKNLDKIKEMTLKKLSNDWEQRKVKDIANRYDNLRIPVAANLRVSGRTPYYGANGIQDYVDGFTHEGEFVLVAEDGANDLKNYPVNLVKGRIWVNNHAHVLQTIPKIANNAFLAYSINQSDIESLLVGGGRAKLNAETLMNIEMAFPTLLEQESIGEFLTSIDNLITLHQCKFFCNGNVKEIKLFGYNDKKLANAWEQRKFSDIADTRRGLTYSPQDIVEKGVRVLRSSNIKEDVFVLSDDDVFVCKKAVNIEYVSNNDILITSANGSTRLVGKHAIIVGISNNSTVHGGFMLVATAKNPFFLNASMSSNWYTKFISLYVSGGNGAIGNLSKSDLDEQIVLCPSSREQDKVGKLFRNIDRLITLHQCKYLKKIRNKMLGVEVKKACSKTTTWEQRKLGENVPIIMGQSPDGSTYSDKPSDYILVQGNADLENGWVKPRVWTTQKTKLGSAGDLIMSVRAPAGSMGKTRFDVVLGRGVAAIKGNEFIYQLLIKKDIDGYWKRLSAGSTFESLNSDTIYNAEIVIPEREEQKRLGELFEFLDNLITLHQRE